MPRIISMNVTCNAKCIGICIALLPKSSYINIPLSLDGVLNSLTPMGWENVRGRLDSAPLSHTIRNGYDARTNMDGNNYTTLANSIRSATRLRLRSSCGRAAAAPRLRLLSSPAAQLPCPAPQLLRPSGAAPWLRLLSFPADAPF